MDNFLLKQLGERGARRTSGVRWESIVYKKWKVLPYTRKHISEFGAKEYRSENSSVIDHACHELRRDITFF